MRKVLIIAAKDIKIYFFKAPNVAFGLFLPLALYLAFIAGRTATAVEGLPGLIAISIFFSTGAVQSISLPLERRTGTFTSLLTSPVTLHNIIAGKILAGAFFGCCIALSYSVFVSLLVPVYLPVLMLLEIIVAALAFSGFGLLVSAPFRDIPQAMPPATVLRIALVFFSGVFIPMESIPGWLQWISLISPVTSANAVFKQAMNFTHDIVTILVNLAIQCVILLFCYMAAVMIISKTMK